MHRNISRAYDALWAEHERIRRIHMRILSQRDPKLERRLLRANPDCRRLLAKTEEEDRKLIMFMAHKMGGRKRSVR